MRTMSNFPKIENNYPTFFSPPFKMSYLPATKLFSVSAGLHATVLTDGKAMITQGLGAGQIVKLEDWLILAGDDVAVFSQKPQAQAQEVQQVQEPVQEPFQEEKELKNPQMGSKFRWSLDANNYRVAIMTTKGVLQVKSVTEGITDKDSFGRTKTLMFYNEAAWRASLPEGNAVTELVAPDTRTSMQKRIEEPLNCRFENGGDADKLYEFMSRFKIRNDVITESSPNEMVKNSLRHIESLRTELNNITLEEELAGMKRHTLNLSLNRSLRIYSRHKSMTYKTQNPDVGTTYIYTRHTNRLRAVIGGLEYEVGIKGHRITAPQIAIRHISNKKNPAVLYNSFKDMGNPKFYIIYRRSRYDLPL